MSNVSVKWKNYKDMDELVEAIFNQESSDLNKYSKFSLEELFLIKVFEYCAKNDRILYKKDISAIFDNGDTRVRTIMNDLTKKGILEVKRVHENGRYDIKYFLEI